MRLHTFLRKSPFGTDMFGKAAFTSSVFGKTALATAALTGLLFLAAPPGAKAAGGDDCQRLIAKTEHQLGEAIEDHGYNSRQANHWREERREAYQRCYGNGYARDDNGYYRGENGYYRDQNGYYRDERGNYYYRSDSDRRHREYDRDRRRERDRDDD
jgi:hypothetical protein